MFCSPVASRVRLLGRAIQTLSYWLSEQNIKRVLRLVPSRPLRQLLDISDTMQRRSEEIIRERKEAMAKGDAALLAQVGEGKDIMSICRTRDSLRVSFRC